VEKLVLREGGDVEGRDSDGLTPMMAAARAGQLKVIQRLLEIRSPSLNATDVLGRTALDHAVEAQSDEVVTFMTSDTSLLNFSRGLLPAVVRGDEEVVRALLDAAWATAGHCPAWANANMCDFRGASLLHCAVRLGSEGMLTLLLSQPSLKAHVNALDRYGRTALDAAEAQGRQDLAFMLRGKGGLPSTELED
ncbi:unnamed protein product, partial [Polarella glacialis]